MIDIHSHVIYDCDDGSKDIEQSLRMLKIASEAGITDICFTPHYMEDGYKSDRDVLEEKLRVLKECVKNEKLELNLYLGEEVFIFPNLPENLDKIVCLNDSKYLLFELPLVEDVNYIDDVIYKLFSMEKVPILAHPERYFVTAKDFSFIQRLYDKGVLFQMNLNSLVGHYGKDAKKFAEKMLKEDMVHCVGSDAHSSRGYIELKDSISVLSKLVGNEKLAELTEINPRKILLNQDIEHEICYSNDKKKSIFTFFSKGA